jgi:hypothetical protein
MRGSAPVKKRQKMIRNSKALRKFEYEIMKKESVNILRNFRLVEAMHKEAMLLGVFPLKDPLSGIEVDIAIAKVINSVSQAS